MRKFILNTQVRGKVALERAKEKVVNKVDEFIHDDNGEIGIKGVVVFAIGMVILLLIYKPMLEGLANTLGTIVRTWWSNLLDLIFVTS